MQNHAQESARSRSLWWNEPIVTWQANQVAITFHSPVESRSSENAVEGINPVIRSLNLEAVSQFLATHGFQLKSFTLKDVPHPPRPPQPEAPDRDELEQLEQLEHELEQFEVQVEVLARVARRNTSSTLLRTSDGQLYKTPAERDLEELEAKIGELEREIEQREQATHQRDSTAIGNGRNGGPLPKRNLNSPVGKYLFASPSGHGTLAICFFHCTNPALAPTTTMHGNGKEGATAFDTTQAVVKLLNQNLEILKQDGKVPIVAAMPNWISGGAPGGGIGQPCPATVPIPVSADQAYSSWHFTLPYLSPTLQSLGGNGTTVFVLDTIPTVAHVLQAAANFSSQNALWQSMSLAMQSNAIEIYHQWLPSRLGNNIQTGKDVYGRKFGFKMADHGLFVTGIIHDLVPDASLFCMRVLNDFGVGDLGVICDALYQIQQGMIYDNFGQVVVNLSLIVGPPDDSLPALWFGKNGYYQSEDLTAMMQEIKLLWVGFHMLIKSLVAQGAVVVASAGNESDVTSYQGMGSTGRYGPRYPAAFPETISVGAVDGSGVATSYSDYPALAPEHNGVATYGGSLPSPVPPATATEPEPAGAKTWAVVSDAAVGLYSSSHYPLLAVTDEPPDEYSAPAYSNGWAYWSGTSFATPIVSSLSAMVLQAQQNGTLPTTMSVQDAVTTVPGQKLLTGGSAFANNTAFGVNVGVLNAEQKHS